MNQTGLKSHLATDNSTLEDKNERKRQRDIANKQNREKKYKDFGFSRLKIYLGRSTYENLAEIYEDQQKSPLNIDGRKDIDSLSQVISFCINHTYEQLFVEDEKRGVENVLPANNPRSQELYDQYQTVAFLRSKRFSPTEAKNKLIEEGCRPPNLIPGFDPKNRSPTWTVQQVKDLLKFEILNNDLENLNG
ncbi:TPA: hypothetical protein ACJCXE_003055 [Yersinia enterocolitica]|nr:hypothetical protein [Yersinia enterocolitica]HDL7742798.1 hypothetical protein [Yersinia enterocolitica]HDL8249808.1 hypothetical protein [Yersinia enterocolitica]HDM8283196.1 hypothetical protein [Yersinia enterocolitica]HEB2018037.1 hypothetical protein [Yersinia enterocolitica]